MEGRRELPVPTRIDIRQLGGGIDPDMEDDAILTNPHAAYFPGVAPSGGYEYPRFGSCICHVPYTTHIDYGGELYENQIRDLLEKHMASGEYPIIRYDGVVPEFVSILPTDGGLTLRWYAEDPSYTFNIYRSLYKDSGFELLTNVSQAASDADNVLALTGYTSGTTYFFYITAVKTVEGPKSKVYGAKVL